VFCGVCFSTKITTINSLSSLISGRQFWITFYAIKNLIIFQRLTIKRVLFKTLCSVSNNHCVMTLELQIFSYLV
jgi:hypothetical protein